MARRDAVVEMTFSDGSSINTWESFTLRDTFTDPLGDLSFTVRPPRSQIADHLKRLAKGEQVGVRVDGNPIAAPLIVSSNKKIDREGVTFEVQCESVLTTTFEGSVDTQIAKKYSANTSIERVLLDAFEPYGFEKIDGDAAANTAALTGKPIGNRAAKIDLKAITHKEAQAQPNESAYAFAARFITRYGLVLRVTHEGVLLVTAPDYDQDVAFNLVQEFGGGGFNVDVMLDGISITDTNKGQFSEVLVFGRAPFVKGRTRTAEPRGGVRVAGLKRPDSAPFDKVKTEAIEALIHTYSSTGAPYKPRFRKDKFSRDLAQCIRVATMFHGSVAKDAFVVSCEVNGFVSATGRTWAVDTIANVVVEAIGFDEDLWVLERTFKASRAGGQTTSLKLLPKNALLLGEIPS